MTNPLSHSRSILITIVLLVFQSGCTGDVVDQKASSQGDVVAENGPPNFVFLLVDDLGYSDIGAYNASTFYQTPNIDHLAGQGVTFTDGYAANPVCSPSRLALMTGRHPTRFDATDWFHVRGWPHRSETFNPATINQNLPLEETTLPERLKAVGYATAFLGKWHLGEGEEFWPENQGFDVNVGGIDVGQPPNGYFSPYRNERLPDGADGEFLTERLTNEAVGLIERYATLDQPFFLYMSYYTVHTPLEAPENTIQKYIDLGGDRLGGDDFSDEEQIWPRDEPRLVRTRQNHATYAAMIESLDKSVGRIMEALESTGELENTVVVFTSDNGGLSTAEGSPTSNLPLRGGKGWLYEGGIRVPYIVSVPGAASNGQIINSPVVSMDLHDTIVELAGADDSDLQDYDGVSLIPILAGDSSQAAVLEARPIFFHYPHYSNQGGFPGAAVRHGKWKYVERFENGQAHLYDISVDVGERNDVIDSNPTVAIEMQAILRAWYQETGAEFLRPKDGVDPWYPTD